MSNKAITWAYAHRTGRGAGCKAVLIALADMADEAGSCYPGQELLGELTEQDTRSIRTQIAHLMSLGLVRKEPRFRTDGKRTSDRYVLALELTPAEVEVPTTGKKHHRKNRPVVESTAGNVQQSPPETVSATTGKITRVTLREPSGEPSDGTAAAAASSSPPAKAPTTQRGSRLPTDWKRTEANLEWQAAQDIPEGFARIVGEEFRNYWWSVPGTKGNKLDWSRTWQNWLSKEWHGGRGSTWRREHGQAAGTTGETEAERARRIVKESRAKNARQW